MAKTAAAMHAKVETTLVSLGMRKTQIRSGKCPWPAFVQARERRYPKSVSCGFVPVGGLRLGDFGVAPGNAGSPSKIGERRSNVKNRPNDLATQSNRNQRLPGATHGSVFTS